MTMLMSSGGPRRGVAEGGVKVKGGGGCVALNVLHEGGDGRNSSLLRCRTIPTLLEGLPYAQKGGSNSTPAVNGAGNKRRAFGSKGADRKHGMRNNRQTLSVGTDGTIDESMSLTSSLTEESLTSSPANGERAAKARNYIGSAPIRSSPINKSGVEIIVDGISEDVGTDKTTGPRQSANSTDPLRTTKDPPLTTGRCFTLLDDDNNDEIGPLDLTPLKDYHDSNSQMFLLGDII